jgi:hypothetical protein
MSVSPAASTASPLDRPSPVTAGAIRPALLTVMHRRLDLYLRAAGNDV